MKNKTRTPADRTRQDRERNDALNNPDKSKGDEKLPGDYPPEEDIMNRLNTQRVGMDVENFSRALGVENLNINEPVVANPDDISDGPITLQGDVDDPSDKQSMEHPVLNDTDQQEENPDRNESDVTAEDLQALGPKDLSMDMGEDEQLKNRVWPVDMAGEDLDIPGAELDDAREAIGAEDEENNSYSLGGDAHEDNLEGK